MVSQLKLNTTYGVKVLAVQRGGLHHRLDIRGMRIKSGDMFLVQGDDQAMGALIENPDFLVIHEVDKTIPRRDKAAMVANTVRFRPRSAIREVGKAMIDFADDPDNEQARIKLNEIESQ